MSKLADDIGILRRRITESNIPSEMESRVMNQLAEVERVAHDITSLVHVEQIVRYVDWVAHLPWNKRSTDVLDLTRAKQILNKNHYGLDIVKERILEYLSVLQLNLAKLSDHSTENEPENTRDAQLSASTLARRAPILCLVGLVGTGKTTLAKSIAQAMGRQFVRIPLGGMSSPLDLRGQSRVRPDAEIGLVMKGLRYAGTKNPVMLLDEIDRVAESARGDIMGVLVELLDPEQNSAFVDHFLDYPFDLSEVLFVTTANNTTHVATAVLDRLEMIQMPSYTDTEKTAIAKEYVLPALMHASGLTPANLIIDEAVWAKIVRPLGYDAGIRSLERTINGICRKVAKRIVEGNNEAVHITQENVKQFVESY